MSSKHIQHKREILEPIPPEQQEAWKNLIARTKKLVKAQTKDTLKLIVLVGEVDTVYGESKIAKWAEAANVSLKTAYNYRTLYNKGVDALFVEKWSNKLTYEQVRLIAYAVYHLGRAEDILEDVAQKQLSPMQLKAYFNGLEAFTSDEQDEMIADVKWALGQKQEKEHFDDYTLHRLEELAEKDPTFAKTVLTKVIMDSKDVDELEKQAGKQDYDYILNYKLADKYIKRFKRILNDVRDKHESLSTSIKYDHELSDELKLSIKQLAEELDEIAQSVPKSELSFDAKDVIDITEVLPELEEKGESK